MCPPSTRLRSCAHTFLERACEKTRGRVVEPSESSRRRDHSVAQAATDSHPHFVVQIGDVGISTPNAVQALQHGFEFEHVLGKGGAFAV